MRKVRIMFIFLIWIIIIFSCFNTIIPIVTAGISGQITSNTTWSGTVYIEGNVIVDPGVTLTIDPGTQVRFNGMYTFYVGGNLTAIGTPGNRIQFISNSTVPTEADWNWLQGGNTAKFDLAFCDFKHFLSDCSFSSSPTVNNSFENCTFSNAIGTVDFGGTYDKIVNCSFPLNWGVSLQGTNNYIANCTFTNDGLYLFHSYTSVFENNVISTTWGMEVNDSDNNVFRDFIMDGELYLALNSNNNTFENFTFNPGSGIRAIQSGGWPEDNFIVNSTIPLSIPIFLSNSYIQFINDTFDGDTVFYNDLGSELWVKRYMHVNVTYSSGLPVPNANVWVNNTLNVPRDQYFLATDLDGFCRNIICHEYQANDSNDDNDDLDPGERQYYTPHNVTVEKGGMKGYADVTMDATRIVNIVLVDDSVPSANFFSPTGTSASLDSDIFIQWNDTMDWTTVENSFEYTDGTTTWDSSDGTWVHNNMAKTSTFNPASPFDFDTQYWVGINITATDAAGNPLDQDKDGTGGEWTQDVLNWTFTTASNAVPTITINVPNITSDWTSSTPHAIWWNCTDTEDKTADSLTLFLNYTSSDGSGAIAGPLLNETANPHIWALPVIDAANVVVHATVIDSNGAKGYFDTPAFTIDSTTPQLIEVSPANNTVLTPPDVLVLLTFDESMNRAETEAAFTLENGTSAIGGAFSWNAGSTVMTFTPAQDLKLNTTYWANITTGAEDNSEPGNPLASFNSTEFKIMAVVDTIGPKVTVGPDINPSPIYVDGIHDMTIWINATIDDLNLGNNNIAAAELMIWDEHMPTIQGGTGIPMIAVDGTFDEMNESVTIDQDGFLSLPEMTLYYWVHGQDSEGNWGEWKLVTLQIVDRRLPTIESYSPTGTNVNPNSSALFSFDKKMNHTSVMDSLTVSPYLDGAGGFFYNTGNYQDYNFSMFNNFHQNITYTITINSSMAKDPIGNFLDGNENGIAEGSPTDDVAWSFTTWWDRDMDGIPENIDPDDDNDLVNDTEDAFPLDPDESVDTDGDDVGNNEDMDDDGDGVPDSEDLDPLNPAVGGDVTPPSAPTNLNLTALDPGILVKWEAPPELDVHHYAIYRSTDNVAFTRIGNITGSTSYLDSALVANTTYYYKVSAIDNASNESPFSDVEHITWQAAEQPPPNAPNDYWPYVILMIIIIAVILGISMMLKKRPKKPEVVENKDEHRDEVTEETGSGGQEP